MNVKTKQGTAAVLGLTFLLLTACSGGSSEQAAPGAGTPSATAGGGQVNPATDGPLSKYDPPITITTVKSMDLVKFKEGESIDNNVWTRSFEKELGIKLKYEWSVDSKQYDQKMNVTIASGTYPDFFRVSSNQLQQLVDGDKLADLTAVYQKYASDFTKALIAQDGGAGIRAATFKGKLMAIPSAASLTDQAPVVWVRTDWLTKLNLPEPKTMEDVLKIAEAFTKNDPDGNQKKDTYGLIADKTIFDSLKGLFNSYHAYPNIWIKDSSGKLVFGTIQPEMKTVLAQLQKMYKDGQIDPEFGVKDFAKTTESLVSGKTGLTIGSMAYPLGGLQNTRDNNPQADWKPFPITSIDSQPVQVQLNPTVNDYYVVSKSSKNPEAALKLLNFHNEKRWGATADPNTYHKSDGVEVFKYAPIANTKIKKNLEAYRAVKEALDTKNVSKLDAEQKGYYDSILKFQSGDLTQWGYARVFGEGGSQSVIDGYDKNNKFIYNEYIGAATPAMTQKQATLDKLALETFTKIILGDSSINEFDTFVEQWKKLGGEQITKEVNEAMAAK